MRLILGLAERKLKKARVSLVVGLCAAALRSDKFRSTEFGNLRAEMSNDPLEDRYEAG
jgi:hypothetical protein